MAVYSYCEGWVMEERKHIFCCNCGEKLDVGSKFCYYCGTPTGAAMKKMGESIIEPIVIPAQESVAAKTTPTPVQNFEEPTTERKTVYQGEIYKCPSCGEILNAFTAICSTCGTELREAKSSKAISVFNHCMKKDLCMI